MLWRWVYSTAIIVQSCAMTYLFIYGTHGWHKVWCLQRQLAQQQAIIAQKKQSVAQLICELDAWKYDHFYKEKVAREQLQMGRKDEIIFYRT
jgi:cell division protein FtsB